MTWSGSESGSATCDAAILQIESMQSLTVSNVDAADPLLGCSRMSFQPKTYTLTDLELVSVSMPGSVKYELTDAYVGKPLKGASATLTFTAVSTDVKADATHGTMDLKMVQYDETKCGTSTDWSTCGVGKGVVDLHATF
jgi:hypothetical protein